MTGVGFRVISRLWDYQCLFGWEQWGLSSLRSCTVYYRVMAGASPGFKFKIYFGSGLVSLLVPAAAASRYIFVLFMSYLPIIP